MDCVNITNFSVSSMGEVDEPYNEEQIKQQVGQCLDKFREQ
jgi:hypothetical protein